jgi:hypothetical protein
METTGGGGRKGQADPSAGQNAQEKEAEVAGEVRQVMRRRRVAAMARKGPQRDRKRTEVVR